MTGKMKWIAPGIVLAVLASLATITARASSLAQEPQSPDIVGDLGGPETPLGTGFTYQGKLNQAGVPHTGACDFQFILWDAAEGGNQISTTQTETGVALSEGLFTVDLDFGSTAFWGNARWLQIAVRCPTGSGGYTTLDPRQALTAAPYALYAPKAPWSGLTGVPAGFADGVDDDTIYNRAAPAANYITTLDSTGTVGWDTSITIGADGLGLISYYDSTNADLKVAHCSNTACTAATLNTLDSTGVVGAHTSIAIGADGLGLISYYDSTNADLKVAHCSNTACTAATLNTLDSTNSVGTDTSIVIGADGRGLISYYDSTAGCLMVAHCSNAFCTVATYAVLDAGNIGSHTAITIGADGLGLISYYDAASDNLKVAHCSDTACTTATRTTLNSTGDIGSHTSITIGTDGLPVISYYDATNTNLKMAHCSNAFCVPYFRRR